MAGKKNGLENDTSRNPKNILTYLLDNAMLQDSLLQSYRNQHLTTQTIIMAISTGLLFALTSVDIIQKPILGYIFVLQLAFTVFGFFMLWHMIRLIRNRGKDVDFWHHRILEHEIKTRLNIEPGERQYFCEFKTYQTDGRPKLDPSQGKTPDDVKVIKEIIELMKGKERPTHTRNILDESVSYWLIFLYILLIGSSVFFILASYEVIMINLSMKIIY